MLKRHEVEILLKAGHPKTEVARLAGVSLRSVKRIAGETPVTHIDDAAERGERRIGRPSIVEDFRKPITAILGERPDLASLEVLRQVRIAGYRGGKTALYALVAAVRPKEIKPLVRFEGLPGEFSQHDFGQVEVEFIDGSSRRMHFFAQPEMERRRSPLVSIPPFGRGFSRHGVFRSDGGWAARGWAAQERVLTPPFIVSMSPPGYPSAWLRPRSARFRFAQQDHCSAVTTCRFSTSLARDSARTQTCQNRIVSVIA